MSTAPPLPPPGRAVFVLPALPEPANQALSKLCILLNSSKAEIVSMSLIACFRMAEGNPAALTALKQVLAQVKGSVPGLNWELLKGGKG